jgi:malate dehydrogenase (oxaloacetate-decarboxylating)
MMGDGLSKDESTRRFWCVDKQGLLIEDMADLRDYQREYARQRRDVAGWATTGTDEAFGLAEVVAHVHPTIIVGTSTVGGAFTEPIIRDMAGHVDRPMIFPLSNPTDRIEAEPTDVIEWTDGRGLVGTGTPWPPVRYKGVEYFIGQANNALVYPGIGLGTMVSGATHVTDGMLVAAAEAIAGLVVTSRPGAGVLPEVANLREMSATVAVAVARQAAVDGVAQLDLTDVVEAVQEAMWHAEYPKSGADGRSPI